jgi:hypothetical protein
MIGRTSSVTAAEPAKPFVWTEPDRFDLASFSLRFWRAGLREFFSPDSA